MKILFISSANRGRINSLVKNQGSSLEKKGIEIEYYGILGKGLWGYLKNIPAIRKRIRTTNPNIIHAHFSLSAFAASIAKIGFQKKLVVSLMGSDTKASKFNRVLIRFFNFIFWDIIITKTVDMKETLGINNCRVIPNGVNLATFNLIEKQNARQKLQLESKNKIVIWIADKKRYSKNYQLAEKSIEILRKTENVNFLAVNDITQEEINLYLCATDVLLLTSRWEGSPNIIKEAMACNCPITATDVGDIRWLFGNEPGHFITTFNPPDIADKIKLSIEFVEKIGRTRGRERIIELGLDSETVAAKLINIYKEVIAEK